MSAKKSGRFALSLSERDPISGSLPAAFSLTDAGKSPATPRSCPSHGLAPPAQTLCEVVNTGCFEAGMLWEDSFPLLSLSRPSQAGERPGLFTQAPRAKRAPILLASASFKRDWTAF